MIKGSTIVRTSKPVRKEWKQSYSCFTEEMYLGKNIKGTAGKPLPSGELCELVVTAKGDDKPALNKLETQTKGVSDRSERRLDFGDQVAFEMLQVGGSNPPHQTLIFQSSINPKK